MIEIAVIIDEVDISGFQGGKQYIMTDHTEKNCPKCGQKLRFPKNIGGMLMACPSCGKKFYSDFKLGKAGDSGQRGMLLEIFELPSRLIDRIGRYFSS